MISALLTLLASPKVIGTLVAVGGFLATVLTAFLKGRKAGRDKELQKQKAAELKAANERLWMQYEGIEARRRAQAMSDAEARKEALKWTRK